VTVAGNDPQRFLQRGFGVDGGDAGARDHDLHGHQVLELEDVLEHLGALFLERSVELSFGEQQAHLVLAKPRIFRRLG
jgi:hypothetical protein